MPVNRKFPCAIKRKACTNNSQKACEDPYYRYPRPIYHTRSAQYEIRHNRDEVPGTSTIKMITFAKSILIYLMGRHFIYRFVSFVISQVPEEVIFVLASSRF